MSTQTDDINRKLLKIICDSDPRLIGLAPAIDVIPGMCRNLVLHAGPPLDWPDMPVAMQSAVTGALVFEGLSPDLAQAEALAASGGVEFSSAHDHQSAGAMAGIVTSSMPVFVVEDATTRMRAFVSVNEGLGKALRFGANDHSVLQRLDWIRSSFGPLLNRAIMLQAPISLKALVAEALRRGDECHNRNKAATSLFLREIAPALVETGARHADIAQAIRFIGGNDHFFLSLSMAHAKAVSLAVEMETAGSVVTVMAGNGRQVGIRVSGTGRRWFTAVAQVADVRLFPGHTRDEATPTMGDSYVTETIGLGGFALAAAPAIAEFVGGTAADLCERSERMRAITVGEHRHFLIPQLGFRGVPTAIDVHKVAATGIAPIVNTGVASRQPGIGQIGAGVQTIPIELFLEAAAALGN